jgi:hypothetical protein
MITGSNEGLMVGTINLEDVKTSSDYELLCLQQHIIEIQKERLTVKENIRRCHYDDICEFKKFTYPNIVCENKHADCQHLTQVLEEK